RLTLGHSRAARPGGQGMVGEPAAGRPVGDLHPDPEILRRSWFERADVLEHDLDRLGGIGLRLGRVDVVLHAVAYSDHVDHLDVGQLAVVGVRDLELPVEALTGLDGGWLGVQHHADTRAADAVGGYRQSDLHVTKADVGQMG